MLNYATLEMIENLAILGGALRQACVELMADYGLETRPDDHPLSMAPAVPVLVAAVDFKGRELRGTVAFWAPRSVIRQTGLAAPGLKLSPNDLPLWTCELTNQLLGRVKNKLRSYDVVLTANVPRLLGGGEASELEEGLRYRFSCDLGLVAAYLDVLLTPGFTLRIKESVEPLANEGDLTLF